MKARRISSILWTTTAVLAFLGMTHPSSWGQFYDVSSNLSLLTEHHSGHLGTGLSMADFNGDHIDDLSFASGSGELKFYQGVGTTQGFIPVDLGLYPYPHEAKMVLWCDVNNDGLQDLFVTYRLAPNKLYLNLGDNSFNDVSASCGIQQNNKKSYGACFGDFDKDGFNDLFVCNYSDDSSPDPRAELYRNNGDGTFEDITESSVGFAGPLMQGFQAQWVDLDGNDVLDIHVVRDRPWFANNYFAQTADGSGEFLDVADAIGLDLGINCMTTTLGDYDRDADLDAFLSAFPADSNWLMVNHGGFFSASDSIHPFNIQDSIQNNQTSWAGNWLDVNNDGWEDLYVATGYDVYTLYPQVLDDYPNEPDRLHYNLQGVLSAGDSSLTPNNVLSFSTAVGDYDLNGFPDLVSNAVGDFAHVLRGVNNGNHWLKIKLLGSESNRDGIGSKITVWTVDGIQFRMTFCGENYLGQNSWWEHFGLAEHTYVDSLEVQWPSGTVDHFEYVSANQHLLIHEGAPFEVLFASSNTSGGCTYPIACNYNASASIDDGSCDFTCLSEAEACGPGTAWDPVAEACMPDPDYCPTDFTFDGVIGIPDLLVFLQAYSASCP